VLAWGMRIERKRPEVNRADFPAGSLKMIEGSQ